MLRHNLKENGMNEISLLDEGKADIGLRKDNEALPSRVNRLSTGSNTS